MMFPRYLTLVGLACLSLAGCGGVLEEQRLAGQTATEGQQDFGLDYAAMTMELAHQLNRQPFSREVKRAGIGGAADLVAETHVLGINPLPSTSPMPYRIGVGDELQLITYSVQGGMSGTPAVLDGSVPSLNSPFSKQPTASELARPTGVFALPVPPASPQPSSQVRKAIVSEDGSVLFIETGTIQIRGLTVPEGQRLISNELVRAGLDPRFQFQVSGFNSQRVNLTVGEGSGISGGGSFPLTERPITLRELLVSAGMQLASDGVQVVSIDRGGKRYGMPVEHVYAAASPEYYLTGGDTVRVEKFGYRDASAFLVGGGVAPITFPIKPEERKTLADILFVKESPLATRTARSKEIYLLRGTDPMRAYHLDAQDPSRLRVAAELELRPNDIVFVSLKPIYSINELLAAVRPLAVVAGYRED